MCVIIYRPQGHALQEATLRRAIAANPDGWGIMYALDDQVVVQRGMDDRLFWPAYDAIPSSVDVAIHFRIKTHGLRNTENTHPFRVLSRAHDDSCDIWLMHNGIIYDLYDIDKNMSDTWHWVTQRLQPLLRMNNNLIDHSEFQHLLELDTAGSRLILLDHEGRFIFLHKQDWVDFEGCLFSNEDSLPWRPETKKSRRYRFSGHYDNAVYWPDIEDEGDTDLEDLTLEDLIYQKAELQWADVAGLTLGEFEELIAQRFDDLALMALDSDGTLDVEWFQAHPDMFARYLENKVTSMVGYRDVARNRARTFSFGNTKQKPSTHAVAADDEGVVTQQIIRTIRTAMSTKVA